MDATKYLAMRHDPEAHVPYERGGVVHASCWGLCRIFLRDLGVELPEDYLAATFAEPPLALVIDPMQGLRLGDVVTLTSLRIDGAQPHAGVMLDAHEFVHIGPAGTRVTRFAIYRQSGCGVKAIVYRPVGLLRAARKCAVEARA